MADWYNEKDRYKELRSNPIVSYYPNHENANVIVFCIDFIENEDFLNKVVEECDKLTDINNAVFQGFFDIII